MIIGLNKKNGIILKTSGKYCSEDIIVHPDLPKQSKTMTVTENGKIEIRNDDEFYALSKVDIVVNVPVYEKISNAEGKGF